MPRHSILHIATAFAALAVRRAGARAAWWFALVFGGFYTLLGLAGWATGARFGLSLQAFDHPFHVLLGGLGLVAALIGRGARQEAGASP